MHGTKSDCRVTAAACMLTHTRDTDGNVCPGAVVALRVTRQLEWLVLRFAGDVDHLSMRKRGTESHAAHASMLHRRQEAGSHALWQRMRPGAAVHARRRVQGSDEGHSIIALKEDDGSQGRAPTLEVPVGQETRMSTVNFLAHWLRSIPLSCGAAASRRRSFQPEAVAALVSRD